MTPRAGSFAAATASFAVAAGVTVHLSGSGVAPPTRPADARSSAASVSAAVLGAVPPGGVQAVPRTSYAGAEARTVLQRSDRSQRAEQAERSRPVSRDAARTASPQGRHTSPERRPEEQRGPSRQRQAPAAPAEETPPAPAWVLPVASGYRLSAGFGECSGLWGSCHTGLDFAAPSGTPVRAVSGGTITEVGWAGAYGNRTVQTLEDGTEVWYCHQDAITVSLGAEVAAGQQIGTVGSTGNSTGPHLHLEVRPGGGDPADPSAVLASHGLTP